MSTSRIGTANLRYEQGPDTTRVFFDVQGKEVTLMEIDNSILASDASITGLRLIRAEPDGGHPHHYVAVHITYAAGVDTLQLDGWPGEEQA